MSFLISGLLKDWRKVYPRGKAEYQINYNTRAESIGRGVWVECLFDSMINPSEDSEGLRIKLQIWYNRMKVDIYEYKSKQHRCEEFLLKKHNWRMKDRNGSGFGLLVELGRWIISYDDIDEDVNYFFEADFTIGSWELEWNWEDYALNNDYFDERFTYEVLHEDRKKGQINVRVTSPYEIWPMDLYSLFDMFVLIFWFRFPKVTRCIGRDRWACVSCYREMIKKIWDIPEEVEDPVEICKL